MLITTGQENALERERALLHDELQHVERRLNSLCESENIKACFTFFGALFSATIGTCLVADGVRNIQHGNTLTGALEITGGMQALNHTNRPAHQTTADRRTRKTLTMRQQQLQKQLYDIEKVVALRLLSPAHYLYAAVINQFIAIDTDIAAGRFSPIYIDIAINTQYILRSQTPEAMCNALNKHRQLTMKPNFLSDGFVAGMRLALGASLTVGAGAAMLMGIYSLPALILLAIGITFIIGGIALFFLPKAELNNDIPREVNVLVDTPSPLCQI